MQNNLTQYGRLLGVAVLALLIGFGLGYFWINDQLKDCQRDLQTCQSEHTDQLKKEVSDQEFQDMVYYSNKLDEKEQQLQEKENDNIELRKKAKLDSINILSLDEALRAVNDRYRPKNR